MDMASHTHEPEANAPAGALPTASTRDNEFSVFPLDHGMVADAIAMRQVRSALDSFSSKYGQGEERDAPIALERPHVIALLTCLHQSLSSQSMRPANLPSTNEEDLDVFHEHPAMTLLQNFIDVLADLDNAKRNAVFQTPTKSRAGSLSKSESRRRDALLELVDVIKEALNLRTRAAAEREVARMLSNTMGRSRAPTAEQLKEWRKTRTRTIHRAKK